MRASELLWRNCGPKVFMVLVFPGAVMGAGCGNLLKQTADPGYHFLNIFLPSPAPQGPKILLTPPHKFFRVATFFSSPDALQKNGSRCLVVCGSNLRVPKLSSVGPPAFYQFTPGCNWAPRHLIFVICSPVRAWCVVG